MSIEDSVLAENTPAVTLPQKLGLVVSGIPILANLLSSFGVWHPTTVQLEALEKAGEYGIGLAAALVGGDAIVRLGRNHTQGKKYTAQAQIDAAAHYAAAQAPEPAPEPDTATPPPANG